MRAVAKFWERKEDKVKCFLCPVGCDLKDGQIGSCGVRVAHEGKLYTYTYGSLVSMAVDPVEKKPLFHFYPAHRTLTIATPGCNLHCIGCQNWEISQVGKGVVLESPIFERFVSPEEVVSKALETGCESISYSYSDPTIFAEYMMEVSKLAKERGLKNVMVTAGYVNLNALEEIDKFMDAYSVDLKFFSDESYRKYSKGRLDPVLESLRFMFSRGKWLEITTLLVPQYLDRDQIREIARFIAIDLAPWVPWHISRFFPHYRAQHLPPTPTDQLEIAYRIGKEEGLDYIYVGNLPGNDHESTFCPTCGSVVIKRLGFQVAEICLEDGRCATCDRKIEGIFTPPLSS